MENKQPDTSPESFDTLKAEAAKAKRTDFERYLASVADVPAQAGDALSIDNRKSVGKRG